MQYKSEKYGIECMEADKWYPSSKMCSSCGSIKKDLKLSNHIYKCACSHVIDWDLNAAINWSHYELVN